MSKPLIQSNFTRAIHSYQQAASLQLICHQRLMDLISPRNNATVLDLGCGSVQHQPTLDNLFKKSFLIHLDISKPLLEKKDHAICGDAEQLPLAKNSIDVIFSNLCLQWTQLEKSFQQISQALKNQGVLYCSLVTDGSLFEMDYCWREVFGYSNINSFPEKINLQNLLNKYFSNHRLISETITLKFNHPQQVLWQLKNIGSSNLNKEKCLGLITKNKLQQVYDHYQKFQLVNGLYPATYQIQFMTTENY